MGRDKMNQMLQAAKGKGRWIVIMGMAVFGAAQERAWAQSFDQLPLSYLRLGEVASGGSACEGGSIQVDEHLSNLGIHLPHEVRASRDRRVARSTCHLSAQFTVPEGYGLEVVEHRMKFAAQVASGATGSISSEFFVTGFQGEKVTASFAGPIRRVRELSTQRGSQLYCRSSGILRLNQSATIIQNGMGARNSIIRDLGHVTQLRIVRCGG